MSRFAGYRYLDHNDGKQGTRPAQVQRVYGCLRDRVDTTSRGYIYVKATDIELDMANDVIGRCIAALRDCDACPLNIEVWSGANNPPATYLVESGDQR